MLDINVLKVISHLSSWGVSPFVAAHRLLLGLSFSPEWEVQPLLPQASLQREACDIPLHRHKSPACRSVQSASYSGSLLSATWKRADVFKFLSLLHIYWVKFLAGIVCSTIREPRGKPGEGRRDGLSTTSVLAGTILGAHKLK